MKMQQDEMYPVYSLGGEYGGHDVDVTPEQVAKWTAAAEAFEAAQDEMHEVWKQAETVDQQRREQERKRAEEERRTEADERRRNQERRRKAAEKASAQLRDSLKATDGRVYDAHGNEIGVVAQHATGLHLKPPSTE